MNRLGRSAVIAGTVVALVAPATGAMAGTTAGVPIKGGTTTVTTGSGIAPTLLKNKLFAYAVGPGRTSVSAKGGLALKFSFPVTGGKANLKPLGGKVRHKGGIAFVNLANGKRVKVGDFTIDLSKKVLTGTVNGDPKTRVPIFKLDLSKAKVAKKGHSVTARGVKLKLTGTAAGALNGALSTKVFAAGLPLGTAYSHLRV